MASHLTVTTAANPGVAVKGLNAQASAGTGSNTNAETGKDLFAELLGSGDQPAEKPPTVPSTVALTAAGLVDLPPDTDTDEKPDDTPDAIAAPIMVVTPIQQPATPQTVLTGIVDGLNALRAAAQSGKAPSADDLAKLNDGLDTLANMLGLSLDDLPSMDELTAMASQPLPAGSTVEAQLVSTLAPLTQTVLTDAANAATTDTALSDQLKAIGDKLASLLKGLNDGSVDLDAMADLDGNKAAITPDLDAALKRLLQPLPLATNAATPVFTAPKLETAEPALSGKAKPADAAAPTDADADVTTADTSTTKPVIKADATPDSTSDAGHKSDKAHDKDKAAPAAAAAATTVKTVDTTPDAQSTGQIGNQVNARVEVAAARPIIAGYQTNQQHLNLPQIAFEMARQVNDGNSRFHMRLDPPELGKIEVRIDIDKSGQVNARLTVEKAETLDLMQRDQRGLEKALQQAGLDGSKTNLEFSLKQNSSGQQQAQDNSGRQPFFGPDIAAEAEETPAPTVNLYRASLSASGVNIIA